MFIWLAVGVAALVIISRLPDNIYTEEHGEVNAETARIMGNLAEAYKGMGKGEEAQRTKAKVEEILDRVR